MSHRITRDTRLRWGLNSMFEKWTRAPPVTRQMHENAWEAKWFINKEIEVWMKLTAMILTNVQYVLDLWYNSLLEHSVFHPHTPYGRHDCDSPLFSNSDSDTTSLCTNSDSNTPINYWNSHSKLILSWQFMLLYWFQYPFFCKIKYRDSNTSLLVKLLFPTPLQNSKFKIPRGKFRT